MQHCVCHVEFASNNLAETGKFFQQLFGWQLIPMGEEYTLWTPDGDNALYGGFTLKGQAECGPDASRTLVYIAVEDIEAKCRLIESLGGQILVPKTKISDEHGCFAHFRDPQGTIIGLWSQT